MVPRPARARPPAPRGAWSPRPSRPWRRPVRPARLDQLTRQWFSVPQSTGFTLPITSEPSGACPGLVRPRLPPPRRAIFQSARQSVVCHEAAAAADDSYGQLVIRRLMARHRCVAPGLPASPADRAQGRHSSSGGRSAGKVFVQVGTDLLGSDAGLVAAGHVPAGVDEELGEVPFDLVGTDRFRAGPSRGRAGRARRDDRAALGARLVTGLAAGAGPRRGGTARRGDVPAAVAGRSRTGLPGLAARRGRGGPGRARRAGRCAPTSGAGEFGCGWLAGGSRAVGG